MAAANANVLAASQPFILPSHGHYHDRVRFSLDTDLSELRRGDRWLRPRQRDGDFASALKLRYAASRNASAETGPFSAP